MPEGTEEYEKSRKALKNKYATEPEVFCDNAYDVKILALAMESTDPGAVKAALKLELSGR